MAKKKQIELTIEEKLQNALVPKEEQPYKIPNNWCWTYLTKGMAECWDKYRKPINATERNKRLGNIPYYGATGQVGWIDDYLTDEHLVLIGEDGAPFLDLLKNKAYIIKGKSWVNNHAHILKSFYDEVGNKYLCNYLNVFNYKGYINGTTRLKLTQKNLDIIPIPLPPINEQQRIVNIIESLFAKLDRAKELIENTLAQFEQNKMAILHRAFIGELTAKWRKEKGILKDTWKSMALENCGTWSGGGTPSMSCGDYWENGNIPWITSKDMKNIYIEKTQKYITEKGVECSSAKYIDKPAILFVTRSGILRRIFPVCMVKIPFTVNQDLKVLVPSKMVCLEYLYWICIYKSNKILGTCMKSGTTVESISTDKLKKFKITVPIIEEQQEIVNILDKLLAKYNKIKNLEQQLEKIELLKKAILAKAFRGELGTNNPDEESAENLLKEILAEK